MYKPRCIILLPLFLIPSIGQAQSLRIDSLRKLWSYADNKQQQYLAAAGLFTEFDNISQDSCYRYAQLKLGLARELEDDQKIVQSYLNLSSAAISLGRFEESESAAMDALRLSGEKALKGYLFDCYNQLGSIYKDKGDYNRSLEAYFKALKEAERTQDAMEMGSCYNNIANVYKYIGEFEIALKYYRSSIPFFTVSDSSALAGAYNNIGTVYKEAGRADSAEFYYFRSLGIYQLMKDSYGLATCYSNIGGIYFDRADYLRALEYDLKSMDLYTKLGNVLNIIVSLNNIAGDFIELGDLDKALDYSTRSLDLAVKHGLYMDAQLACQSISEIYALRKDFENAYHWFRQAKAYSDTLGREENKKAMLELQAQYETEKKEKEIEILNEKNSKNQIIIYSSGAGIVMVFSLALLAWSRYRGKQRANVLLESQNREIQAQKEIIETKNKDITDSIHYAKRIQSAILPSDEQVRSLLPGSFVFFRPKDIVSGDFYWVDKWGEDVFFAAVDCTGHGVPGALMSVVGYNLLNQALNEHGISRPHLILNELNKGVAKMLRQRAEEGQGSVQDGMDVALCSYNRDKMLVEYGGAFNALYHVSDGRLSEYKADKIMIGSYSKTALQLFTPHQIGVKPGDMIYIFSDGLADQFGGPKGKKFKYRQLKDLLTGLAPEPVERQKELIGEAFERWKGKLEQVDDVLLIGVKIG
ncbi:MAG: tetratricopeptide repeat protein [Bacteroidota bacterium]